MLVSNLFVLNRNLQLIIKRAVIAFCYRLFRQTLYDISWMTWNATNDRRCVHAIHQILSKNNPGLVFATNKVLANAPGSSKVSYSNKTTQILGKIVNV